MEGLIPFVMHVFKKSREQSKYGYLKESSSTPQNGSSRKPLVQSFQQEGSSHGHNTQLELQPAMVLAPAKSN